MSAVSAPPQISIRALTGIPPVRAGDDLPGLIEDGLRSAGLGLQAGDVVVIAQKIVSKAEGRLVDLESVRPGAQALQLAREVQKDARIVELILSESRRVVRKRPGLLIVEHRLGFVMANAGVDQSNTAADDGPQYALLLPEDPDASARTIREQLERRHGARIGVLINDSFGRPWRRGTVGVALGTSGLPALLDLRGRPDLFGRPLRTTVVAHADEIAAAASLLMGQADEGRPVVLVQGAPFMDPGRHPPGCIGDIVRPEHEDLFR